MEMRIVFKGDGVTDVDRYWSGSANANKNSRNYVANTFNGGTGDYSSGKDSAIAFSWLDKTIASGETQRYSVLVAGFYKGSFRTGASLTYDLQRGVGSAPEAVNCVNGAVLIVGAGSGTWGRHHLRRLVP